MNRRRPPRVKNIFIVHGALADGSGWRKASDSSSEDSISRSSRIRSPHRSVSGKVAAPRLERGFWEELEERTNAAWHCRPPNCAPPMLSCHLR